MQGSAKRILIVSYHFYPDAAVGARRMSELARHLCREGHEVVVVAGRSSRYMTMDSRHTLSMPNLRCIRVPLPPKPLAIFLQIIKRLRAGNGAADRIDPSEAAVGCTAAKDENLLQKAKRIYHSLEWLVDDRKLWGGLVALRLAAFIFRKPFDVVISSGPPMSAHLAVLLARPVLRGRWIMDMRDPWSDQDHWRTHVQSRFSRRANRYLEQCAVNAADVITVTTPSYARILRRHYSEKQEAIQLVLNGFEGEVEPSAPPQGRLDLLYAGTLYYNRDPFPLLRAIRNFLDRPDIDSRRVSFRLFGRCRFWGGVDIDEWATRHGLQDCISTHPGVPANEIRQLMTQASVLVNFAQGQPMQIPAKMFEYMAARRDVLLVTEPDSDSAWLARRTSCTHVVAPDDEQAMEAVLAQLYEKYVAATVDGHTVDTAPLAAYSRETQNERFLELFDELAAIGETNL